MLTWNAGFLEGPIGLENGTELVLKRRSGLYLDSGGDIPVTMSGTEPAEETGADKKKSRKKK